MPQIARAALLVCRTASCVPVVPQPTGALCKLQHALHTDASGIANLCRHACPDPWLDGAALSLPLLSTLVKERLCLLHSNDLSGSISHFATLHYKHARSNAAPPRAAIIC